MATELDGVAATRLEADGQRYTDARKRLVAVLSGATSPMTIPEILRAAPGLAQSSAYRNLGVLERAGVVQRIVTNDEWARFELAEDLTEHHHHVICTSCGIVRDVRVPTALEQSIDGALAKVAKAAGFTLDHHRLDLVGVCRDCRGTSSSASRDRRPR